MSERYELRTDKRDCEYIHDSQIMENFTLDRACDLLNSQAETIEVLREWIREANKAHKIIETESKWSKSNYGKQAERIELSKARIAALEET